MNIAKKLIIIYTVLVILYYLPMINIFTQLLIMLTPFALYIYWSMLTIVCIAIGWRYIDRVIGK